MNYKLLQLFALTLICFTTAATAREWTDVNGRSMEAEFVRTEASGTAGTEVIFKMPNGMHARVPLSNLIEANQLTIAELTATNQQPLTKDSTSTQTEFERIITKNLVKSKGSRTKRVSQDELEPKDYYAIYYSAHWCPPCRKFTPKLVDFYNQASKEHENFEIIFVSSDRSEDDMAAYMEETDMPWLALDYDKKKSSNELTQFAGSGIPCLVLVDSNGKVLSDSYENGKYVGPTKVMNDLKKRLQNGSD
jgi:nucleoredoxin